MTLTRFNGYDFEVVSEPKPAPLFEFELVVSGDDVWTFDAVWNRRDEELLAVPSYDAFYE